MLAPEALLFLLAAGLMLAQIGSTHLSNYDDCFYAQRAKEMLQNGDWVTPHWAGEPQVDNPPLFLWIVALSFALFGIHGYAAVLPSALSGAACVALLYRLGRRLGLESFTAWTSSFVLLTTGYFLKFSGHAMLDVFLALLFLLALYFYTRAEAGDRRFYLLVGLAVGLSILTKSVIGLLPGAVIVLHLAWTRRVRVLGNPWFLAGAALALGVGLWWFAYEWWARPEAFVSKWSWMLWDRSFVIGNERMPWWKYFDYFLGLGREYWPWLPIAAVGAVWVAKRAGSSSEAVESRPPLTRETARLLILWFFVVVGALSLANEKKLWYVMTVFPCLAVFSALAISNWIRAEVARRRVIRAGYALLFVAVLWVNLGPTHVGIERRPDLQRMALAARTLVPPGQPVLSYDISYYSVTPQFLFYSDHKLTQPLPDPGAVRRGLDEGAWALLKRESYAEIAGADSLRYPVVVASGRWVLVCKGPRPAVRLEPRDAYR
jgi:4-amino-4-deoxy-L-arabinose transferase-like glycosyltransferase